MGRLQRHEVAGTAIILFALAVIGLLSLDYRLFMSSSLALSMLLLFGLVRWSTKVFSVGIRWVIAKVKITYGLTEKRFAERAAVHLSGTLPDLEGSRLDERDPARNQLSTPG